MRSSVVRLLRRRRVDHHSADDLAQEALLRCIKPDVKPRNFRAFAKHVAQNLAKNLWRAERPAHELTSQVGSGQTARPSQEAMRREQRQTIDGALGVLSSPADRIVRLRHEERLDFAAIAAQVRLSEAATRKRYSRALSEIRAALTRIDA